MRGGVGAGRGGEEVVDAFERELKTGETGLPVAPRLDARIPKWRLGGLEARSCPLCRVSNGAKLRRPDMLPVAFCRGCELWYVSSLPPAGEVERLYQGYWHTVRRRDLSPWYASQLISDEGLLRGDIRLSRLASLGGGLEGKRLLEIGCGCGEFLVAARRGGCSVIGNDIAAESCRFVREHLKMPVVEGEVRDGEFTGQYGLMDMVVMSDLIEHPIDPLAIFETALKVLRPGGLLLMVTPNGGEALDGVEGAMEWVGFRVDLEHLQYLSAATVASLAGRYGCRIEHLESYGFAGLEGIDRLPEGNRGRGAVMEWVRARLKRVSAARRIVREGRKLKGYLFGADRDNRCGSFHLLAILRKPRG